MIDVSTSFNGAVEEMSERNIMKAICQIEQKLLIEDDSPSIHDSVQKQTTRHMVIPFLQ